MNNLEIKTFNLFKPFPSLVHGLSTRKGGFSKSPYNGLNLGLHTDDDKDAVLKNRKVYFKALNIKPDQLVFPEQVHSDHIAIVNEPGIIQQCDALITNRADLFLSVQTADCFPVLIFDTEQKAAAIVHSGWRGAAKNITGKTIEKMKKIFNSQSDNLLIAVGAGIQQSCYQVNKKTAMNFDEKYLLPDTPGHYKLDVQAVIIDQILETGVRPENIERDTVCTHCNEGLYFSYRRNKNNSGRMMSVIGFKNNFV